MTSKRHRSCYEKIIEEALAMTGIKAVFQFSTGNRYGYIIDFAIPDRKIIIECDGERYHQIGNRKDRCRDDYFKKRGCKTIRLRGLEIQNNTDGCIDKILSEIQ